MNNIDIYNAVISGLAGSTQNFTSQTPSADFTRFGDRSVILASAVDALIAPSTITQAEAVLMAQIVAGIDLNRSLLGVTPNFASMANDIVKLWTQFRGRIVPSTVALTIEVDTIAQLRALVFSPNLVFVKRYSVIGTEGGGGLMVRDDSGVQVDDGGTYFVNSVSKGYFREERFASPITPDWWGAHNLAVDNSDAINAAASFLPSGGELVMRKNNYYIQKPITGFAGKTLFTARMNGAQIIADPAIDWTGKVILSLVGTRYDKWYDLYITVNAVLHPPAVIIGAARLNGALQGGQHELNNLIVAGYATHSVIYLSCSELTYLNNCHVTGNNCLALFDSSTDPIGIGGAAYVPSNIQRKYTNCTFGRTGGVANAAVVEMSGYNTNVSFDELFLFSDQAQIGILYSHGVGYGSDPVDAAYVIQHENIRFEMAPGYRGIVIQKGLIDSAIDLISPDSGNMGTLVELQTGGALINCDVNFRYKGLISVPFIRSIAAGGTTINSCKLTLPAVNTLEFAAGGSIMVRSTVIGVEGQPCFGASFSMAAAVANSNRFFIQSYTTGPQSYDTGVAVERYSRNLTADGQSVGGCSLFKLVFGGPTNFTNFIDGRPGQQISIICNGLGTFKEVATMHLLSGADTVPASGNIINFVLDGTVWRQC